MSLRVWLPLTGDLNNQGLSNITVTNNGAALNAAGKLGSCYSFDGSDDYIALTGNTFYNTIKGGSQPFSIAMWIYHADATRAILFGDFGLSGAINFNIELTTSHTLRFYWNGSPDVAPGAAVISQSTWAHAAYVYNGSSLKFYVNGELKYTWSGTLAAKTKSSGSYYLGRDSRTGTTVLNGRLNDFRLYDHALSVKEVEELARGLVLHYKLDGGIMRGQNLIANSKLDATWPFPTSSYSDKYSPTTLSVPAGDVYTLSFDAKSTVAGDVIRTHYYSPNTTTTCISSQGVTRTAGDGYMTFTLSKEWQRYWVTYYQTTTTAVKHIICPRLMSGEGTGSVSVKNVKFEEGKTATPWSPAPSDAAYDTAYSSRVCDCSGYKHHGSIVNTLVTSSNTPCYTASIKIPAASSGVKLSNFSIGNVWSMGCWFYYPSKDNTGWKALVILNNNGGDADLQFGNFINCSGTNLQYSANGKYTTGVSFTYGTWNHVFNTYDGTVLRCYLNGQYQTSVTPGQTLLRSNLGIGFKSSATDFSAYGNSATNAQISDVRVYATALSDKQVLELYNESAAIDRSGTYYTRELIEQ